MILDKKHKLEKILSEDPRYIHLNHIYIDNNKAIASNGFALAIVPTNNEDTNGYLPKEEFLKAKKLAKSKYDDIMIGLYDSETGIHRDGTKFLRNDYGEYADYKSVIPSGDEPKFKICLDAKLLFNLSEALGSAKIVLEFTGEQRAIKVYPTESDGFGLLMPCRIPPDYKEYFNENHILEQKKEQ